MVHFFEHRGYFYTLLKFKPVVLREPKTQDDPLSNARLFDYQRCIDPLLMKFDFTSGGCDFIKARKNVHSVK